MKRAAALAAAVAIPACFLATGCGGHRSRPAPPLTSLSGARVISEALDNTLATSFTASGILNGPKTGLLGIHLTEDAGTCQDTYGNINAYGQDPQGTVTEIVRGGTIWWRPSNTYFLAHAPRPTAEHNIAFFGGRYAKAPVTAPSARADAALCDLRQQWDGWARGYQHVKPKVSTYGGQRVIRIAQDIANYVIVSDDPGRPRLIAVSIAAGVNNRLSYSYSYSGASVAVPGPAQSVVLQDGGL